MMDPWDISPVTPPYCRGGFEALSPEQMAAEKETHKRYCKGRIAEWRQKRPQMVPERLQSLHRYQVMPGPERHRLPSEGVFGGYVYLDTCVYLMRCPSISPTSQPVSQCNSDTRGVCKIGHTDNLERRTAEHRRGPECGGLDPDIQHHTIYYTPIRREILERLLLDHFKHFRCSTDLNDELFNLPQEEADGFEAIAKAIEQHLLAVEFLRLNATLSWLKAGPVKGVGSRLQPTYAID